MRCSSCGRENRDGLNFCSSCGHSLATAASPPVAPPSPSVAPPSPVPATVPIPRLCAKCGAHIAPGKSFCPMCGTPVGGIATPVVTPPQRIEAVPPRPPDPPPVVHPLNDDGLFPGTAPPPAQSTGQALAQLGILVTKQTIIGFCVSIVAGVIVARLLPYLYVNVLVYIFNVIFAPGTPWEGQRDAFNTNSMTFLTFLTSALISAAVFRIAKKGAGRGTGPART